MLRKALEEKLGSISNLEFKAAMEMTTEDIKFNNITFGKRTSPHDVITIAERSILTLRRCV